MRRNANRLFSPSGYPISPDYSWMLIVSHMAIPAGNILILQTSLLECLLAKSLTEEIFGPHTICKKCCLHCLMKATNKTKRLL
jgi:hypothetical protein